MQISLETRVARLEKASRRWKLAAIGLGAALLGVVGLGAAQLQAPQRFTTVKADRYIVADSKGKSVAMFGRGFENDNISLFVYREPGKPDLLFHLTTSDGEPSIGIHGKDGTSTATLYMRPGGKPSLEMRDKSDNVTARVPPE